MDNDIVVMEIRGVGGATAEEILQAPVVQVGGDELAGFFRTDEPDDLREAYEWGRLTSGSPSSALWWILFPFTLANVSGWMFRPSSEELDRAHENRWSSLWLVRGLVALGSLAITGLYVLWAVTITTEIVVFGCVSTPSCYQRWYLAPLEMFGRAPGSDNVVWLSVFAIALAALPLLALFRLIMSTQDKLEGFETDPTRRLMGMGPGETTSRLRRNTQLDDQAFWYKWAEHRRLVRWHLGLSMAVLGVGLGHALAQRGTTQSNSNAWWAIGAIAAAITWGVWNLTRPEKFRESADPEFSSDNVVTDRIGWTLIHISLGLAGVAAGYLLSNWLIPDTYDGFAFLWLIRNTFLTLVVGGLVVIAIMWRRKRTLAPLTDSAPAAMPGLAAALAVFITVAGFSSLANLAGRLLLGAEWVEMNQFNIVVVDILALGLLVVAIAVGLRTWRGEKPTLDVIGDYYGDPDRVDLSDREESWVRRVAMARLLAGLPREAGRLLAALTTVMLIVLAVHYAVVGIDFSLGNSKGFSAPLLGIDGLASAHTVAASLAVLYLFPGLQLIRSNSRSRASRRQIGKVWDVLSFWPRRFHPLAAPCYAERSVPEFRNRIRDHLQAGKRVVISSHSQGTVIAFAALVQIAAETRPEPEDQPAPEATELKNYQDLAPVEEQLPDAPLQKVGLLTFGSPLTTLYGRFFPWHFGTRGRMQRLRDQLATLGDGESMAWRSLYRPTDYIGREVFVPPGGDLEPFDEEADIYVLEARQPLFPYDSHSNYEATDQLRDAILEFTADVT